MDDSTFIKIGPVGKEFGTLWDEKGKNKIVQIFVSHDENIISIQFQYYAENGTLLLSGRHGSTSTRTPKFDIVKLNYPSEYITWISCRTGSSYYDSLCSITFRTNHGQYGPFGRFKSTDKESSFQLGHQFGGFYGTSYDNAVTSIGVYLKPNTTVTSIGVYLKPNTTLNHSHHKSTAKPKKEGESFMPPNF